MDAKKVIIVPHTHWDREWYLPFQRFRYMLVDLIDELLDTLKQQDFMFMLDGQTVVLEDYFEIRPERKEELLQWIRQGKIAVGPWYILPDEWLVGGESLIRNLEYSYDLGMKLDIPLMQVAYLPDQFGHSSVIPQLIGDLTNLKAAVLWRGVPPDIMTVPFTWKSYPTSSTSIRGIYLPGGYGNVARFPENYDRFVDKINESITELEPFSPLPLYLMMNGSDHLVPQPFIQKHAEKMKQEGQDVTLGFLNHYVEALEKAGIESSYNPPVYAGEFRSPARAPLLQDTYSTRMWIKLWNQRVEDILLLKAEPVSVYLWHHLGHSYPTSFLETAWKWLLRNHPHDSICGCSADQTHAEMKVRFSWAESIAESIVIGAVKTIEEISNPSNKSCILAFTSGTSLETPVRIEFSQPRERSVKGLQAPDGTIYNVQPVRVQEDIFLETTVGMTTAKMGIAMLPGRKLINFYINDFEYYDGDELGLLELRLIADRQPVGDFDMEDFKKQAHELIKSKRYKKIHLVAVRPSQSVYAAIIPLRPWAFTQLNPVNEAPKSVSGDTLEVSTNHVNNRFYSIIFNKDGTLNAVNTETGRRYERLHAFEDFGDRGDVYTFGRVEPEKVKVRNVKRFIMSNGPVMAEIRQTMVLEVFETLDDSREKRVGKVEIPIESIFRFYRDTPRVETTTRLTNTAKDHRLRICFDLPFSAEITQTATHLGCVTRKADAERIPDASELERTKSTYPEMPSGIQPQKRFIRVEDEERRDAITVFNKGMPEVELVDRKRIAITLVRSVGWLSRSDYPERPIHAGPPEETQGAQEIGTDYEFRYGLLLHSAGDPLYMSAEHGEAGSQEVISIALDQAEPNVSLLEPIIELSNPNVRISSLRVRNGSVMVTMFNLKNNDEVTEMKVIGRITKVMEVRIDGTTLREHSVDESKVTLGFSPREIKMCILQQAGLP